MILFYIMISLMLTATILCIIFPEENRIEYYNSDFDGQIGIKNIVSLIDQEKIEMLYEKFKFEEYFSVKIQDQIKLASSKPENVYGEEIQELTKKYWNERVK